MVMGRYDCGVRGWHLLMRDGRLISNYGIHSRRIRQAGSNCSCNDAMNVSCCPTPSSQASNHITVTVWHATYSKKDLLGLRKQRYLNGLGLFEKLTQRSASDNTPIHKVRSPNLVTSRHPSLSIFHRNEVGIHSIQARLLVCPRRNAGKKRATPMIYRKSTWCHRRTGIGYFL